MGMLKFAEDFTRLIIRYTKTSPNNDTSNGITPLTDEEVVFTIHHVLHALSMKGFDENNNNNLLEISDSAKAATVPEISVMNIKRQSDIENTCRFQSGCLDLNQDVQSIFTYDDSPNPDISLKVNKKEKENSFNTSPSEKEFLPQSNPAICINNISRSDTFVREEKQEINTEDQEGFTNTKIDDLLSDIFQVSWSEIRQSVMDIMTKLNNLEQSFPQLTKLLKGATAKGQKSSLINSCSSPSCTSAINKTKVPANTCKSTSVFPRTPTSSKLSATEKGNISERRKSTGGIGTNALAGKSGKSKVGSSVLNLTFSPCNKKASPGSSVEFQTKFMKNPKYAYVRSTIPKAINQKKKMHHSETVKPK